MSKIPRDINGAGLAKLLKFYGYTVTRQTGSHIRLTSQLRGSKYNITIPDHNPIKIGTLNSIMKDISSYLEMDKSDFIKELFP